jgi:hypothetical protein
MSLGSKNSVGPRLRHEECEDVLSIVYALNGVVLLERRC